MLAYGSAAPREALGCSWFCAQVLSWFCVCAGDTRDVFGKASLCCSQETLCNLDCLQKSLLETLL